MACVAQSLAELLHAVSIHNDSVPATRNRHTHTHQIMHITLSIVCEQFLFKMSSDKSQLLITLFCFFF